MKKIILALLIVTFITSCASSKYGCPGSNFSGERYKATKFKW